jgi:adenosylhomocysteine nucleosidase
MSERIIIVAALEREVLRLVMGWPSEVVPSSRGRVKLFAKRNALVAVGGIGTIFARAAADTAYRQAGGDVGMLISAGLAGALTAEWKAGDVFQPATIIDDADGLAIETGSGAGTLITAGTVADAKLKRIFAAKHIAQAVDMEAYAVADVARVYGVPFRAVKAISDELQFPLPPLGRFIGTDGSFRTGQFALYAAVRPWIWNSVAKLGKNSKKASEALCTELATIIARFDRLERYNRVTTKP